jgi:peroxiredoxin
MVAVSGDTPEQIRAGKKKHGSRAILLSDRDVSVTDLMGIRNQGFHSGVPGVSAPALAIPTTVLVDAGGIVRWIDQSENYQRRSDPDLVGNALRQHLA